MKAKRLGVLNEALLQAERHLYCADFGTPASVPMSFTFNDGAAAALCWGRLNGKWRLHVIRIVHDTDEHTAFPVLEMTVEARIEVAHLLEALVEQLHINADEDLKRIDDAAKAALSFTTRNITLRDEPHPY